MLELTRNVDNLSWIIEPARYTFEVSDAKALIEARMRDTRQNLVCPILDGNEVIVSLCSITVANDTKYWDFAHQFKQSHAPADSVIYIETQEFRDGFESQVLLVILDKGQIVADVLSSIEDIQEEIRSLVEDEEGILKRFSLKTTGIDDSLLNYFGLGDFEETQEILKAPLTETYVPSESCEFVKEGEVGPRLKPKGLLLRWAIPLIIVIGLGGWALSDSEVDRSKEVVHVTHDEYEDYKKHMTSMFPQASNRFAQDFNNHMIFQQFTRGWTIHRVVHTPQVHNVIYNMKNDEGSLRELRSLVALVSRKLSLPGVTDVTKEGNVVVFEGQNTPVYPKDKVVLWDLREAYELLSDAITLLIPTIEVNFMDFQVRDRKQNTWKSMRVGLDFTRMPISELGVLAQITKGMPISIISANYVVTDGYITGNFTIWIHGEDK